jgi:hypothetical protein
VNVQRKFTSAVRSGPRAQRSPLVSSPIETSRWVNFDDDDEVQEEDMTLFKGQAEDFYDSRIQKLVPRLSKCLDNAANMLKNKIMYRRFIHSVAFVN